MFRFRDSCALNEHRLLRMTEPAPEEHADLSRHPDEHLSADAKAKRELDSTTEKVDAAFTKQLESVRTTADSRELNAFIQGLNKGPNNERLARHGEVILQSINAARRRLGAAAQQSLQKRMDFSVEPHPEDHYNRYYFNQPPGTASVWCGLRWRGGPRMDREGYGMNDSRTVMGNSLNAVDQQHMNKALAAQYGRPMSGQNMMLVDYRRTTGDGRSCIFVHDSLEVEDIFLQDSRNTVQGVLQSGSQADSQRYLLSRSGVSEKSVNELRKRMEEARKAVTPAVRKEAAAEAAKEKADVVRATPPASEVAEVKKLHEEMKKKQAEENPLRSVFAPPPTLPPLPHEPGWRPPGLPLPSSPASDGPDLGSVSGPGADVFKAGAEKLAKSRGVQRLGVGTAKALAGLSDGLGKAVGGIASVKSVIEMQENVNKLLEAGHDREALQTYREGWRKILNDHYISQGFTRVGGANSCTYQRRNGSGAMEILDISPLFASVNRRIDRLEDQMVTGTAGVAADLISPILPPQITIPVAAGRLVGGHVMDVWGAGTDFQVERKRLLDTSRQENGHHIGMSDLFVPDNDKEAFAAYNRVLGQTNINWVYREGNMAQDIVNAPECLGTLFARRIFDRMCTELPVLANLREGDMSTPRDDLQAFVWNNRRRLGFMLMVGVGDSQDGTTAGLRTPLEMLDRERRVARVLLLSRAMDCALALQEEMRTATGDPARLQQLRFRYNRLARLPYWNNRTVGDAIAQLPETNRKGGQIVIHASTTFRAETQYGLHVASETFNLPQRQRRLLPNRSVDPATNTEEYLYCYGADDQSIFERRDNPADPRSRLRDDPIHRRVGAFEQGTADLLALYNGVSVHTRLEGSRRVEVVGSGEGTPCIRVVYRPDGTLMPASYAPNFQTDWVVYVTVIRGKPHWSSSTRGAWQPAEQGYVVENIPEGTRPVARSINNMLGIIGDIRTGTETEAGQAQAERNGRLIFLEQSNPPGTWNAAGKYYEITVGGLTCHYKCIGGTWLWKANFEREWVPASRERFQGGNGWICTLYARALSGNMTLWQQYHRLQRAGATMQWNAGVPHPEFAFPPGNRELHPFIFRLNDDGTLQSRAASPAGGGTRGWETVSTNFLAEGNLISPKIVKERVERSQRNISDVLRGIANHEFGGSHSVPILLVSGGDTAPINNRTTLPLGASELRLRVMGRTIEDNFDVYIRVENGRFQWRVSRSDFRSTGQALPSEVGVWSEPSQSQSERLGPIVSYPTNQAVCGICNSLMQLNAESAAPTAPQPEPVVKRTADAR